MTNEIPFTTGALRDWPLYEELIDELLTELASSAGLPDCDEAFRDEVKDNVRRLYEALNRSIGVTISAENTGLSPEAAGRLAERVDAELREQIHALTTEAFGERIKVALELVALRRQIRKLGGEPFRLP